MRDFHVTDNLITTESGQVLLKIFVIEDGVSHLDDTEKVGHVEKIGEDDLPKELWEEFEEHYDLWTDAARPDYVTL